MNRISTKDYNIETYRSKKTILAVKTYTSLSYLHKYTC